VPLRVALCGAGSAALRAHLPALARAEEAGGARLVGVVDPRGEHRDQVAARCSSASGFPSVEEMLDATRPHLLVIASPPSSHLAAVTAAMERGIDVLCEKPLGVGHGDAATLTDLCERHPDVLLAPVHQYRFAADWERAFRAPLGRAAGAGRSVELRAEVERPGTDPLSAGGWRAAGLREGGIIGDHAVHYVALAWTIEPDVRLAGAEVRGEPGRETATLQLELGSGGTATITVTYAGTRRRNLVEGRAPAPEDGYAATWLDAELGVGDQEPVATSSLADRQTVNDLYGELYDELLANRTDPGWRARRRAETLAVAGVLDEALTRVGG
jgi:predicted dehydrogenase